MFWKIDSDKKPQLQSKIIYTRKFQHNKLVTKKPVTMDSYSETDAPFFYIRAFSGTGLGISQILQLGRNHLSYLNLYIF